MKRLALDEEVTRELEAEAAPRLAAVVGLIRDLLLGRPKTVVRVCR